MYKSTSSHHNECPRLQLRNHCTPSLSKSYLTQIALIAPRSRKVAQRRNQFRHLYHLQILQGLFHPIYYHNTLNSQLHYCVIARSITMSFSTLVSDLASRNNTRDDTAGSQVSVAHSTAKSYASTAATSVSISGDISSQLHGGYSHPLARAWQAERQLTKVPPTSIVFFNPAC